MACSQMSCGVKTLLDFRDHSNVFFVHSIGDFVWEFLGLPHNLICCMVCSENIAVKFTYVYDCLSY